VARRCRRHVRVQRLHRSPLRSSKPLHPPLPTFSLTRPLATGQLPHLERNQPDRAAAQLLPRLRAEYGPAHALRRALRHPRAVVGNRDRAVPVRHRGRPQGLRAHAHEVRTCRAERAARRRVDVHGSRRFWWMMFPGCMCGSASKYIRIFLRSFETETFRNPIILASFLCAVTLRAESLRARSLAGTDRSSAAMRNQRLAQAEEAAITEEEI
jgi:hypothetical protein